MLVEQLMSRPAVTINASDSLGRAAQLLWDHDFGALPVVDDDGCLVGMITDRDICMACYLRGQPPADISVDQAMARQVYACAPGDPIGVAEKLMSQYQVRRVPVADPVARVVGVFTLTDLARLADQGGGLRRPDVTDAEVSRTLAAICQPRREQRASTVQ
ncbi:MAG TPA: CBS domain-containing protein [Kofleriaceae bacterium]|nr:CBS domain-containing protein [Kofleriaceae bacterium]